MEEPLNTVTLSTGNELTEVWYAEYRNIAIWKAKLKYILCYEMQYETDTNKFKKSLLVVEGRNERNFFLSYQAVSEKESNRIIYSCHGFIEIKKTCTGRGGCQ